MTPAQCKAARALLGIGQQEVANNVGLSVKTVGRFECGLHEMQEANVALIRRYFEGQGISFVYRGAVFTADFLRDDHPRHKRAA